MIIKILCYNYIIPIIQFFNKILYDVKLFFYETYQILNFFSLFFPLKFIFFPQKLHHINQHIFLHRIN